jgi:hypothetical protein
MRSEAEIRQKLEKMMADRLRKRRHEFLSKTHRNCAFNTRLRVKDSGWTGFCQCPKVLSGLNTKVFVCNDDSTASACKCFACKSTQESVDRDFRKILEAPSQCGEKYPKIAMLLWVVQRPRPDSRWKRLKGHWRDLFFLVRILFLFRWW